MISRSPSGMFLVAAAFILILTEGAVQAQTAAPPNTAVAIVKAPYVITKPGLYLVKKDLILTTSTGAAIQIKANDVTLDLGGHVLTSTAVQDSTNQSIGVYSSSPVQDVTIRNGVLRNFSIGVYSSNLDLRGRVLAEKLVVSNSGTTGIDLVGNSAEVRDCHVFDTGYHSATASVFGMAILANVSKASHNEVGNLTQGTNGFDSTGIDFRAYDVGLMEDNVIGTLATGSYGISCTAYNSGTGLSLVGNTICNFTTGASFSGNGKYRANLTTGCTTPFLGGTSVGSDNK